MVERSVIQVGGQGYKRRKLDFVGTYNYNCFGVNRSFLGKGI